MTKLMLRNHKANFHRFLKSSLLAAPFILAGMAVTGGHVHADQIQSPNNGQNISQQNVNNTPKNIKGDFNGSLNI